MEATSPHVLLFSDAAGSLNPSDQWRFVLQPVGSDRAISAADSEPGIPASRLELLAVVRGLEALEQPSRVTLLTKSHYVRCGIRRGLSQWRERGYRWEKFGQLVSIRDHDLWRRVDHALCFHEVECCPWNFEVALERECSPAAMPACQEPAPRPAAACSAASPTAIPRGDAAIASPTPVEPSAAGEYIFSDAGGDLPAEPTLLIVPRRAERSVPRPAPAASNVLAEALYRLRQAVLAPLCAIRRPAFTRAA